MILPFELQVFFGIESHPPAIISVRAVFPEPRAPIIATKTEFSEISDGLTQGAFAIDTLDITWEGIAEVGGANPTNARPSGTMQVWRRASRAFWGEYTEPFYQ